MCWVDVKLYKTANRKEFDIRGKLKQELDQICAISPKMFATDADETDLVETFKVFSQKRPAEMNDDDAPMVTNAAIENSLLRNHSG